MLKSNIEYKPAMIEFVDGTISLAFLFHEDEDGDLAYCELIKNINGAFIPLKNNVFRSDGIKSFTFLEKAHEYAAV